MLLPTPDASTQGTKLQFGMLTKKLSAPDYSFDHSTANAYSLAAQRYLMIQLGLGGTGPADPVQLVQLLFLTAKMNLYSSRFGLIGSEGWQQLRFDLEVRCKNAGIDQSNIQNVTGFAERFASSDDVFQFGDASSLDRAKDIEDPKRRNEILVRGSWGLIQGQRFQQAETWIKEVDDEKVRETLTDLLEYYAARASSKDRNWSEVTRRASRIKDGRIALMLLLDTARAADLGKSPQRKIAKQFLLDARALLARIADKTDKAKSLISLASQATEIYPELGAELLPEALAAINASEDYDGSDFQILVEVLAHFQIAVSTPDSSLNVCLKRAARIDWMGAVNIAQNLNSQSLKSMALISACEAIL